MYENVIVSILAVSMLLGKQNYIKIESAKKKG